MLCRQIACGLLQRRRPHVVGGCVDEIAHERDGFCQTACFRSVRAFGQGQADRLAISLAIACETYNRPSGKRVRQDRHRPACLPICQSPSGRLRASFPAISCGWPFSGASPVPNRAPAIAPSRPGSTSTRPASPSKPLAFAQAAALSEGRLHPARSWRQTRWGGWRRILGNDFGGHRKSLGNGKLDSRENTKAGLHMQTGLNLVSYCREGNAAFSKERSILGEGRKKDGLSLRKEFDLRGGLVVCCDGVACKSASPLMTAIVIRAPMSVHSIRAAPDLFFKKRIIKAGIADYLVCGECLDGAHFNVCQL